MLLVNEMNLTKLFRITNSNIKKWDLVEQIGSSLLLSGFFFFFLIYIRHGARFVKKQKCIGARERVSAARATMDTAQRTIPQNLDISFISILFLPAIVQLWQAVFCLPPRLLFSAIIQFECD